MEVICVKEEEAEIVVIPYVFFVFQNLYAP